MASIKRPVGARRQDVIAYLVILVLVVLMTSGSDALEAQERSVPHEPDTPISAATREANDEADRLARAPLSQIAAALEAGAVSSLAITRAYLRRIETLDRSGPKLGAVLTLNPTAIEAARKADAARRRGKNLGPLHGVPILIKDNIETLDPMPTTAGSFALLQNYAQRDAPLVARLRAAGAILLGKTNLSQWANFRSSHSVSGWSALGGITRNPYILSRSPCGSSSGSAVATAASLAAASIGTETNGSIICPASVNGIVGFKPTLLRVSQDGIIPIAFSFDTAGPMTRTVRDAAMLMDVLASSDQPQNFTKQLDKAALNGRRIGVMRFAVGTNADVAALFEDALKAMEKQGATLVEIEALDLPDDWRKAARLVANAEFRMALNRYLAETDRSKVAVRSLEDLILFNRETAKEAVWRFDQSRLIDAAHSVSVQNDEYRSALDLVRRAAREEGIDRMMREHDVDWLVAPSRGPAPMLDLIYGDQAHGSVGAGYLAAMAGYPIVTVPMGFVHGLPIGIDFLGGHARDPEVLAAGFAFEQATHNARAPAFVPTDFDVPTLKTVIIRAIDTEGIP